METLTASQDIDRLPLRKSASPSVRVTSKEGHVVVGGGLFMPSTRNFVASPGRPQTPAAAPRSRPRQPRSQGACTAGRPPSAQAARPTQVAQPVGHSIRHSPHQVQQPCDVALGTQCGRSVPDIDFHRLIHDAREQCLAPEVGAGPLSLHQQPVAQAAWAMAGGMADAEEPLGEPQAEAVVKPGRQRQDRPTSAKAQKHKRVVDGDGPDGPAIYDDLEPSICDEFEDEDEEEDEEADAVDVPTSDPPLSQPTRGATAATGGRQQASEAWGLVRPAVADAPPAGPCTGSPEDLACPQLVQEPHRSTPPRRLRPAG